MTDGGFRAAAVVLAGGASSRMGAPKPFLKLAGRSLIARVLERLAPQVDRTYVNAREGDARFAELGMPLVADALAWRGAGPLAGLAAAMAQAAKDGFAYLATSPCDAPFLPLDLVARLTAPISAGGAVAAVAVSDFGLEPLFALWPCDRLGLVERALAQGRASPRSVLVGLAAAPVRFERGVLDPFANLNTPEELAAAEIALAGISAIARPRSADRDKGDGA